MPDNQTKLNVPPSLENFARGGEVGTRRGDGREARVENEIGADEVRITRIRLVDLREFLVVTAPWQADLRIDGGHTSREVRIDLRAAIAPPSLRR